MKRFVLQLSIVAMSICFFDAWASGGATLIPPTSPSPTMNNSRYVGPMAITPSVFMSIGGGYAFNHLMDDITKHNQHLIPAGNVLANINIGYQATPMIGYEAGVFWLAPQQGYGHVNMGAWLFDALVDLTVPCYDHISFTAKLGAGWQTNNGSHDFTKEHTIEGVAFKNSTWSAILGIGLNYRLPVQPRLSFNAEWLLITSHIQMHGSNDMISYFPSRNLAVVSVRYDFSV